jgi:hypothetical protein
MDRTLFMKLFVFLYFVVVVSGGCLNDCSGRGKCNTETNVCVCQNGFYTDDCSKTIQQALPAAWIATRIVICVLYGILLIAYSYLTYLSMRRSSSEDAEGVYRVAFNSRNLILWICLAICVFTLLQWAVDPNGNDHIYPYWLFRYIFGIIFPLFSTLFTTILVHWSSTYNHAAKSIQTENMLAKINSNYTPAVTVEKILQSVKVMGERGSYVYIGVSVVGWIFQIIRETLLGQRVTTTQSAIQPVWLTLYGVIYFSEALAIMYWGPKLLKVMPKPLARKLGPIIYKILAIALTFAVAWIVITILNTLKPSPDPDKYVALELVCYLMYAFILFSVITLFLSISKEAPFIRVNFNQMAGSESGSKVTPNQVEVPILSKL